MGKLAGEVHVKTRQTTFTTETGDAPLCSVFFSAMHFIFRCKSWLRLKLRLTFSFKLRFRASWFDKMGGVEGGAHQTKPKTEIATHARAVFA